MLKDLVDDLVCTLCTRYGEEPECRLCKRRRHIVAYLYWLDEKTGEKSTLNFNWWDTRIRPGWVRALCKRIVDGDDTARAVLEYAR